MIRRYVRTLAFVVAGVWVCSAAHAAIDYHFVPAMNGQPTGVAQGVQIAPEFGPSNFQVTVSGARKGETPNGNPQSAVAYLDKWGLGVLNPHAGADKGIVGQVELDGKNGGEFIQLEFPTAVRLTYVIFASVGATDMFSLEADGNAVDLSALFPGQNTLREISHAQGNWPGHVDFTQATGTLPFAKRWNVIVCCGDGVHFENVGVEPIPEPSTVVLWLVGLTALGIVRLRRRRRCETR